LTHYGEEALNLLSGFRFLYNNRDYLLKHSLHPLPRQFRVGLSILDNFESVNDVMVSFHNIEDMIDASERFVWILSNQVLASTIPHLEKALERGAEFRLIMPLDYQPSDSVRKLVSNEVFREATVQGKLEIMFVDNVDVFLCLSEREVGALGFPGLDGRLDYAGFKSRSEPSIEWSKALFSYYWDKSSPHVPDQLR
jgi:predicted transcriptional regulator